MLTLVAAAPAMLMLMLDALRLRRATLLPMLPRLMLASRRSSAFIRALLMPLRLCYVA